MLLWKCCTQYVSKYGKLSSGHRTGKGQLSFQSQRKAMPKSAQTTEQLHSSNTLVTEKAKAPHSSTLAWRIPWTEEPGWLQFMGLQTVRHDWETNTNTSVWYWKGVMRRAILVLFFILVEKQLVVLSLSMILTVDFLCGYSLSSWGIFLLLLVYGEFLWCIHTEFC